ncbi:Cell wall alpha-1,3-glucan synthase ags1 [Tulasnella sp. 424]|nr:Cell wall alpha-1,3-glucan synthase ags1 [Tulasnella sp. 424]KAG8967662.1 Cell wall alpha-1,3-glucan synthase ags1 [Tulasnella sp. 425]
MDDMHHPPPRRRSSSPPATAGIHQLLSIAVLSSLVLLATTFLPTASAMRYMDNLTDYNINSNQNAQTVLDYDSVRPSGKYTPSPQNWRSLPTYTLLLDKFADGDPSNNDYFGTLFEHDHRELNFRYGGDLKGLEDKLDYIQGMGIGAIYIAGTPFLNMPWQADSYSAIDFSLLDPHWGTIDDWRNFIDAVHAKGLYLIVDFTVGTMGDFIAWKGYENSSAPFSLSEYDAVWKHPKYAPWGIDEYQDFKIANTYNSSCTLPTMWLENGTLYDIGVTGCYASEFDQYGDMEAFGVHPDYERQLSKFASVQDRLREWNPNVMAKIQKFSCMAIKALDFDGIRIDKATQVTLEALSQWTTHTHQCAAAVGKNNFFIPGEVTGGNGFGSLYYGRGRMPTQLPAGFTEASQVKPTDSQYFLRDVGQISLDAVAFHYSIYRGLSRFLGMDGNLQVAYDVDVNFVSAWNQIFIDNDMINYNTGVIDPKHMYGMTNFDIFRWPSLVNGTQRQMLGTFITSLVMPGIPLVYYGEEQGFYLYDNGASNYLFGRQPMTSNTAWQTHGCYKLGSEQYFNMPLERSLLGCKDDWNSLDHFDPTSAPYRQMAHFMYIRKHYPSLQDGFNLVQRYSNTYKIELPGSNGVQTEVGFWSVTRSFLDSQLTTGNVTDTQPIWLLYTNENQTKTYTIDCTSADWIISPYPEGTVVRNLFYPFDTITLSHSLDPFNADGKAPYTGCVPSITFDAYGFKAYVPVADWLDPPPALTKFTPGHDARLQAEQGDTNATTVDIAFEYNTAMNCDWITQNLKIEVASSGQGGTPTIRTGSVNCQALTNQPVSYLSGDTFSTWRWSATLDNVPDGIIRFTLTNVPVNGSTTRTTGRTDRLMIRKGSRSNVMVFPTSDYDATAFAYANNQFSFTHKAFGADTFRYSWNFGKNWTDWTAIETTTTIPASTFDHDDDMFWEGAHIMVQYWSAFSASAYTVVHSDYGYSTPRRVPQFLARGPYNEWGFDKGLTNQFDHRTDGKWELEIMATWPSYIQLNVFGNDDYFYGDTDGDGIMERLPPNSVAPNYLNMSAPPWPYLSWALVVDDSNLSWSLEPRGQSWIGAAMYAMLLAIPIFTATLACLIFKWSFYGIKINQYGMQPKESYFPVLGSVFGHKEKGDATPTTEKFHDAKPYTGQMVGWPEVPDKRRKVIIATLEYEIIDWKLKVKIGGLGVMSSLMGKAMTDVDLIWVVPKVKDLEYPAGDPAEPIEVIIFGEPYLIEVETHVLDNITYVILDSPVFRAQTKADPYPARMDDLSSAIFYSTWNQAIAATIKRYPLVDIYHINDYHGALAPLYLLPKVLPVCLSLHNAEFQGLWPLRTKEEMKEVCSAFNLSKEVCTKYVQFGNTFNLLHAAASFISVHQKSIGVAGVSDKYGKRSWARYPALWTLKHVDSLPNPDPSDIAALDEQKIDVKDIQVDAAAEAQRPEHKRQAQEWAGIAQDPNADLFVFVGRWSKQKGVDLIADIMPTLLPKKTSIQIICVGPVIDLYGRFAAEKLARLMEMYPDRVYSKPEFTALPPFLFSGADFALIPSRDEPFGLVAVEFGRKGALGVGSRLGGLGLMPGWWFPVESSSTQHMLSQFGKTIKLALKSTEEERAILRARSAVQRFPVVEWRQKTEDFHRRSITTSRTIAGTNAFSEVDCDGSGARPIGMDSDWTPEQKGELQEPDWDARSVRSTASRSNGQLGGGNGLLGVPRPNHGPRSSTSSFQTDVSEDDYRSDDPNSPYGQPQQQPQAGFGNFLNKANKQIAKDQRHVGDPFLDGTPATPTRPFGSHSRVSSVESIASIVDEHTASPLNKAMAAFTDEKGDVAQSFVQKLQLLTADNSKGELSIERYLQKSEEAFFDQVKKEKMTSSAASIRSHRESVWGTPSPSAGGFDSRPASPSFMGSHGGGNNYFDSTDYSGPLRNDNNEPSLTRLQIAMQREIGGWPLYTIIMAIGQMLGATSFQITLLSGSSSPGNLQLYVLSGVFFVASVVWYTLFRMKPSVYVLSIPWIFYALAFFIVAIPSIHPVFLPAQKALTSAATWAYAVASAAGFLFFGLNFGEEAGAATEVWSMRACIVQGSQQVWVAALWYWGSELANQAKTTAPPWWIVLILWPLAIISLGFGYCLQWGLPDYYRQVPPAVPNFMATLFRRKIVLWFLASEILRDYWLSGPYGRNWAFLWSSPIPKGAILALIIVFFVFVWALLMFVLTQFAKVHTWLLPVFAVGLGAPRWCQMLWGTSSLALYIPWAGNAGPYLGTSLWLWLGVLDAIQGVGLGMILLQTLSRLHVCATLAFAQLIGCICVAVARATAPNRIGPGSVFPDASSWDFSQGLSGSPMANWPFWIALVCQLVIVFGYFWFYRKEQLSRP